jgi:hypothetical protein
MFLLAQPSREQLPAQQAALVEVSEKPLEQEPARAFAVPPGVGSILQAGRRLQI